MISLLIGLSVAMAEEPRPDAWRQGFQDGTVASEDSRAVRCGAGGFALGVGSAALGTALVGPCIAGPMIVAGAVVPQIVAGSTLPVVPEDWEEQSWRYQRGYRAGYGQTAGVRRWGAAAVGGLAGAALGTAGAYFAVGSVMKKQGYEPGPFL